MAADFDENNNPLLVGDHEKEQLIRSFFPLVKRIVHRLASRVPGDIDIKEMINSGIIGLVDALDKYDTHHETSFTTYAQFRIRGAILDSFRSQDWVPRSLRHKANSIECAFARVEQRMGRAADDEEVADELGVDIDTYQQLLQEVASVTLISFEEIAFGMGEERYLPQKNSLHSEVDNPLNDILENERIELVSRALERLTERERMVITLYFYEELNLREIGEIVGISESRASQIRSRALIRLRVYLKKEVRS